MFMTSNILVRFGSLTSLQVNFLQLVGTFKGILIFISRRESVIIVHVVQDVLHLFHILIKTSLSERNSCQNLTQLHKILKSTWS